MEQILFFKDYEGRGGRDFDGSLQKAQETSFFRDKCPYCTTACLEATASYDGSLGWQDDVLSVCTRCGWWSMYCNQAQDQGMHEFDSWHGVLRKCALDSPTAPLYALADYFNKYPAKIHAVNPSRFEELVADIYKEAFGYRLEYCSAGQHDLGVDIICLMPSDGIPVAIQVKRTKNPIEISTLHSFAGAMLAGDFLKGIFITTSRFRKGVFGQIEKLKTRKQTALEIDPVDSKRLFEMLQVYRQGSESVIEHPIFAKYGYIGMARNNAAVLDILINGNPVDISKKPLLSAGYFA